MRAAPLRFVNAALWPLTIWISLTHLEEHPVDDYVERTSPIVAMAVAFWAGVAAIVAISLASGGGFITGDIDGDIVRFVRRGSELGGLLWFFMPVVYVIAFWLFTARDERFPR